LWRKEKEEKWKRDGKDIGKLKIDI